VRILLSSLPFEGEDKGDEDKKILVLQCSLDKEVSLSIMGAFRYG
jgi:hypothetical protein